MSPAYLRHEIAQSRANLQVACIDLYYLHNPESQRAVIDAMLFRERLREAFATFEVAVAQGHLRAYGVATWNGLRAVPSAPDYLTLQALLETAHDVAGDRHHFRAVQLPLNLRMLDDHIDGRRRDSVGADRHHYDTAAQRDAQYRDAAKRNGRGVADRRDAGLHGGHYHRRWGADRVN